MTITSISKRIGLGIIAWLSCNSYAADWTFYVVDYPPHIIIQDGSRISGVDIEVVEQAFAAMGETVEFKPMPWKRIIKLMQHGQIAGTVSCSKRDYRDAYMLYSDPISEIEPVAMSKQELELPTSLTLEELRNYRVTTVEGWGMQKHLVQSSVPHQTSPDIESAIRAVVYRDVDVLYMSHYTTLYYVNKMQHEASLKLTPLNNDNPYDLHLCLSKGYPNTEQIQATFNKGLRAIKDNGDYNKLLDQYLYTQ